MPLTKELVFIECNLSTCNLMERIVLNQTNFFLFDFSFTPIDQVFKLHAIEQDTIPTL